MTNYHEDSQCGSCGGPLECHRDAICETCWSTKDWWDAVTVLAWDEAFNNENGARCEHHQKGEEDGN